MQQKLVRLTNILKYIKMNIKAIKYFQIGSSVFFEDYDDYKKHDDDVLVILDHPLKGNKSFIFKKDGKDVICYPILSKNEFINEDLNTKDSIKIGKYLVPEFIEYINLEIEDLKRLLPLVNILDDKHKYEKIIYDAYIKNNSFILTDEQKLNAYKEYKKYRDLL